MSALAWLLLMAIFCAPGFLAQRRLAPGLTESWLEGCAFGALVAFGAFSALTAPLLLLHRPFSEAVVVTGLAWCAATGWLVLSGRGRSDRDSARVADREPRLRLPEPRVRAAALVLAVLTWAAAWAAVHAPDRRPFFVALALAGMANAACAAFDWRTRVRRRPGENDAPGAQASASGEAESIAPERLALVLHSLAVALVLAAMLAATFGVREDTDDVLYLSEVLMLQGSPSMGALAPTERAEPLPATALYAWQSFELAGAMLASATDLHPMVGMRSVMAPVVVLLAFGAWSAWGRRVLPGWLLPAVLLIAAAYYLFGTSAHRMPNNFLLSRAAQGKTWLMNLAIPALFVATWHALRVRRTGAYLVVVAIGFAAIGLAPTGAFLVPIALGAAILTAWIANGRLDLTAAAAAGSAALPGLAFALGTLLFQPSLDLDTAISHGDVGRWLDAVVFSLFGVNRGGGVAELFVLACLPQLVLWIPSRAQLVGLLPTLALLAGPLNPLVYPALAQILGFSGYRRLWWALPFPLLIGLLAACWLHLAAGTRRRSGPCVLVLVLVAASLPLGGAFFAFSERNMQFGPDQQRPPYRATNVFKMEAGLLEIGRAIAARQPTPRRKILCGPRVAAHLAPFDRRFGFVYTRHYQTEVALDLAGRADEIPPLRAARDYLTGGVGEQDAEQWRRFADTPRELLERVGATWVVTDVATRVSASDLEREGYREVLRAGDYSLWEARWDSPDTRPVSATGPAAVGSAEADRRTSARSMPEARIERPPARMTGAKKTSRWNTTAASAPADASAT